ncbi:MAG: hypothetical protein K2P14_03660 [Anaeroplasmataceae bacterium]|nr:hypothetical protein [Anaeroplasmataceae bacterium]
MQDMLAILLIIFIFYGFYQLFNLFIFPKIIEKDTKEFEKNPKWIVSKLDEYYGFDDIDFILADSSFGALPRFRISSKNNRFELLIPNNILANNVDDIIQLALIGKIKIKYGLFFPNKPIYWLSILCYMLDGGNIEEIKKDKKPIDF